MKEQKYSLLIHGPYCEQWLGKIKKQIKNFKYPFEKIVLVSYSNDYEKYVLKLRELELDNFIVVKVKDLLNPGFFNINRQIMTVRTGLNEIDDSNYVFKLRNDQSVDFNNVVKYINKNKITTTNCYTRKDRLYHPSDMFLAGRADLLKKYYSLPLSDKTHLMTEMDIVKYFKNNPNENAIPISPEILLCKNYLKLNNWNFKNTNEDSYNAIKSYFTVVNSWNIDFRSKKNRTPLLPEKSLILPQYFVAKPFKNVPYENVSCYSESDFTLKKTSLIDLYFLLLSKFLWLFWVNNRHSFLIMLKCLLRGGLMDTDLEEYIKKIDFDSQYKRLINKMKNKKILFYGGGQLFRLINSKYDLTKFNAIGICDGTYEASEEGELFENLRKIPIECLGKYKFDTVIVGTLEYRNLIPKLRRTIFKDKKIKLRPLAYLPFTVFIKELLSD